MRNILAVAAAGVAAMALLVEANASSVSAWNTLDMTAHTTCGRQIKAMSPKARISRSTGRVLGIGGEDGDLYYAMMFKGKESGAQARWLCLYDKHTKKAQARNITD